MRGLGHPVPEEVDVGFVSLVPAGRCRLPGCLGNTTERNGVQ